MEILIIEDTNVQSEKLKKMLKKVVYEPVNFHVASSLMGLKKHLRFKKKYYDIVFMDLNLDDGNSITKILQIKRIAKELIIVSSIVSIEVVNVANDNKIKYILQKPFSKIKFNQIINEIINKEK